MHRLGSLVCILCLTFAVSAAGADLRISIPKRTKPTPVQQLNRDGVRAVQKRNYDLAKRLFYKAYLLDPNDPFTLNNLGYVAELEGELERAQRYYALAGELSSDATIDRASEKAVEGKAVAQVAGGALDKNLEINRLNVEAMTLLNKDRAPEAELVLGKALDLDQRNPYTLNNIGYTREKEGDWESALSYYNAAAATGSDDRIMVAANRDWRGKRISEVAGQSARRLRQAMDDRTSDPTTVVASLNMRGVSALNRNDKDAARQYFKQAERRDPNNAFTLNNTGYLAELDGDRETAQFFYAKAREADQAGHKVGMATRADFVGQQLASVATYGNDKVEARMQADVEAKRAAGGPVTLKLRDGAIVPEPAEPVRRASAAPAGTQVKGDTIMVPPSPAELELARQQKLTPRPPVTTASTAAPTAIQADTQPASQPTATISAPTPAPAQVPDIIPPIPPDPYAKPKPPQ